MQVFSEKQKDQNGYIALISTIVISLILVGLTSLLSSGGYFTRTSAANGEYKRISLGLAEACVNDVLLRLAQNYNYTLDSDSRYDAARNAVEVQVGTDAQGQPEYCYVTSVGSPATQRIIATQASFQGAFSSMSITATVQDPSIVYTPPTTLIVYASGDLPSEFHLSINGEEVASGEEKTLSADSYVVSETHSGSYTATFGGDCDLSGNVTLMTGKSYACSVYYQVQPTTANLTVVANIFPSGPVSDLQIVNNSTGDIQTSTSPSMVKQVPANVSYTVSATTPDGYQTSKWSGACNPDTGVTGTLVAGTNYTCVINFSQPAPACADTMMMLDRTGSMFGDPPNYNNHPERMAEEKVAAIRLLDLYSPLSPRPQVSIGSFGAIDGSSGALVPFSGQLTNSYENTDGNTGEKFPVSVTGSPNNQWTNPTRAFVNDSLYATDSTANHVQGYKFNLNLPFVSAISGIEATVDGFAPSGSSQDTGNLAPSDTGNFNSWSTYGTSNKVTAVSNNDGNSTYIYTSTSGSGQKQTFVPANAGIPAGSVINSVTLYTYARGSSSGAMMQLMAEKGSGTGQQQYSSNINLTTSYARYSWAMNTNPSTSQPWTAAEVNSWTSRFGVMKVNSSGGVPRVTQLYLVINYTPPAQVGVDLSWNNGSNWTVQKIASLASAESARVLGGTTDTWGHTWKPVDTSDANFILRVQNKTATGVIVSLNYVSLKIYYTFGLYKTIDIMANNRSYVGTNLADAIGKAANELNSVRHDSSKGKVLILISDGDPDSPGSYPHEAALDATDAAKLGPDGLPNTPDDIKIFTIHFGTDPSGFAGQELLAALASGSSSVPSHSGHSGSVHQTGSADEWPNSSSGYAQENADVDNFYISPTPEYMKVIFEDIGKAVCPAAAGATQAKMKVITQVVNSNGEVGQPDDFHITISGASASPDSFDGSESGTEVIVNPGTDFDIDVTTSLTNYYPPQYIGCSATNNSVAAGETAFCTIVNYDKPPDSTYVPPPPPPANIIIKNWEEKP